MISVFYMRQVYQFLVMNFNKHLGRISKQILKCWKRLNIDNINFPVSIKDTGQFEKHNPDISIAIFKHGGFHKIKENDNDDDKTKEGIVIKDIRVSTHALKKTFS